MSKQYSLGIDIGSTTVKIAITDSTYSSDRASWDQEATPQGMVFSDYERHYANIQETLAPLLHRARPAFLCNHRYLWQGLSLLLSAAAGGTLTFLLLH